MFRARAFFNPSPFLSPLPITQQQADGSPNQLMLNDVAEALGVPRRRLYDVINVFESIEVSRGGIGQGADGGVWGGELERGAHKQCQPSAFACPSVERARRRCCPPLDAPPCPPLTWQVMRRVGKLMYEWVGFSHLPTLLEQLAEDEANGESLPWAGTVPTCFAARPPASAVACLPHALGGSCQRLSPGSVC